MNITIILIHALIISYVYTWAYTNIENEIEWTTIDNCDVCKGPYECSGYGWNNTHILPYSVPVNNSIHYNRIIWAMGLLQQSIIPYPFTKYNYFY